MQIDYFLLGTNLRDEYVAICTPDFTRRVTLKNTTYFFFYPRPLDTQLQKSTTKARSHIYYELSLEKKRNL